MQRNLTDEITAFRQACEHMRRETASRAAVRLTLGLDLDTLLRASGRDRIALLRRLARRMRQQRNRGLTRPSDYDLERHIALGRVLARMRSGAADDLQATDAALCTGPSAQAPVRQSRPERRNEPARQADAAGGEPTRSRLPPSLT